MWLSTAPTWTLALLTCVDCEQQLAAEMEPPRKTFLSVTRVFARGVRATRRHRLVALFVHFTRIGPRMDLLGLEIGRAPLGLVPLERRRLPRMGMVPPRERDPDIGHVARYLQRVY